MTSEAPPFWWNARADLRAWLLYPFSAAYASVAARRLRTAPRRRVQAPVLCVGNFTVGGSGKTPVAIALAESARVRGRVPGFLSRGYGGGHGGTHLVDVQNDSARHVGDEPLLLAAYAHTAVSADRAAAAELLIGQGCDFLIMDDGFQSARVHIDYALIVVDAARGVGNGHVIPAGPLRARLVDQLGYMDGMVCMGDGEGADSVVRMAARAGQPIYHARAVPRGPRLEGRSFLAFAGIGSPQRFFDSIAQAGGTVAVSRTFGDHHPYTVDEVRELTIQAEAEGLELITTAKDAARLRHGTSAMHDLLEKIAVLEIQTEFDPPGVPGQIVARTLEAWERRRIGR